MKKVVLFLVAILFINFSANSTHVAGGELTYKHITGLEYQFKLKLYRDCSIGNAMYPVNATLSVKSVSMGVNQSATLYQVSVSPLNNYCPNVLTSCQSNSSFLIGYEVYEYVGNYTFQTQAPDFEISYSNCCRSSFISNIASPAVQNIFLKTTLNNTNNSFNNSVQYINPAQLAFQVNQNYTVNSGLVDSDGDSLDVFLIAPLVSPTSSVTFINGFSTSNPFGNLNPFTINNTSGTINFSCNLLSANAFAIQVNEYRNGILIGSTVRDMNYSFINSSNATNNLPTLSGVNNSANFFTNFNYCPTTPSNTLSFNLNSADLNSADSTFIEWDSSIVGATVTLNNAQNQTATFSWTPTLADVRPQPYIVTFKVKDNTCPLPGVQTYGYLIYVNQCNTDSVWAGDANADYVVNNYDVLNIGIGNGTIGNIRNNASTNWQAEFCPDWANNFMSGINFKHADCNGDGIINNTDLNAISLNYAQVQLKDNSNILLEKTTGFPDLFFNTAGLTANQGSTLSIPVMLGTSAAAMNNIYGIAGTIEIINSQTQTPISLINPISWIGNNSNSLFFTKNINATKIDFTTVRNDQNNVSGDGQIATLNLPISSNDLINSDIILSFKNIKIISNSGEIVSDFNIINDTLSIKAPLSVSHNNWNNFLQIYPNPVENEMNLKWSKSLVGSLAVLNIYGEEVVAFQIEEKMQNIIINTSTFAKGMYFIKLIDEKTNELYFQKIIK